MSTPAEQLPPSPPASGALPGGGPEPAPGAAPTLTPQKNRGEQAGAAARVQVARRMLEEALVSYGSDSTEGKALLRTLKTLGEAFGKTEERATEIMPAELQTALLADGGPAGAAAPPPGPAPASLPAAAPGAPA